MSSPPRFFGEDSKWLPHYKWENNIQKCMVYGMGVVMAVPIFATPDLHPTCKNPCNPSFSQCRPALVSHLCHTSSLTYLFLQGRN